MVAMLGAIIPLPLPMAPRVQGTPPSWKRMAYSLGWVSVVMMAVAASALPSALWASLAAAAGMPAAKGSMVMGWPMTPVEEGRTSPAGMPRASPARRQHSSARSTPLAAQVLALPLLTRMAWA